MYINPLNTKLLIWAARHHSRVQEALNALLGAAEAKLKEAPPGNMDAARDKVHSVALLVDCISPLIHRFPKYKLQKQWARYYLLKGVCLACFNQRTEAKLRLEKAINYATVSQATEVEAEAKVWLALISKQ